MTDETPTYITMGRVMPFVDPAIQEIRNELGELAPDLLAELDQRDAGARLLKLLPAKYPASLISEKAARPWELAGLYLFRTERLHEALALFWSLYLHMLQGQTRSGRMHKGMPLVWVSECFSALGCPVHAKRYLMMTLCEDAIRERGIVSAETTGIYFRLVWRAGMSHDDLQTYAKQFFEWSQKHPEALFPEDALQQVDDAWQTEYPSISEISRFHVNPQYVQHLLQRLGTDAGKSLEILTEYLMSCMPGCRTVRGSRSRGTEYDVVCTLEGAHVDFRSEFGRHFVCECKDWRTPADFTVMAKFCRVLDSTKSRFGILFSREGVTGQGKATDADSEQRKVFQDRGIIIVVVTHADLEQVALGANLISLLRRKYEGIRLDLRA